MTEDLKKQKKDETQRAHKSEDAVLKEEPETAHAQVDQIAEKKKKPFRDRSHKHYFFDLATFIVSVITLIAVVYYAKQAAIQAKATQIAADAAKLSADASVASSRAWIVLSKYDVIPPSGIADMYIENPGKTPAVSVRVAAESVFVANGPSIQFHKCPPTFFIKTPQHVEDERYSVSVSNVPSVLRPGESYLIQLGADLTPEQQALVTQIPPSQIKRPLKELYLHCMSLLSRCLELPRFSGRCWACG